MNTNDTSIERQKIVIERALKGIDKELEFTDWWPKDTIENYFNYVYTIGFNHGRKQCAHGKRVAQIKDGKILREFESAVDAAFAVGVTKYSISKAASGRTTSKIAGFNWKYV
jgi:hypothetical protein